MAEREKRKWPTSQDPTKGLGAILLGGHSQPMDEDVMLPVDRDTDDAPT